MLSNISKFNDNVYIIDVFTKFRETIFKLYSKFSKLTFVYSRTHPFVKGS